MSAPTPTVAAGPVPTGPVPAVVHVLAGDVVGPVRRRVFGAFVEHLGRCVYGGLHDPSHPSADAAGFRQDVADLVRELGVTVVRYPGGNFVSGYRWEDGVGPRELRPRRRDLAWHSTETNEVGTDELAAWARDLGIELMMAVNLGTRGVLEAVELLEYVNGRPGTTWADRRVAATGRDDPHGVRIWCLGNEMDGTWQVGHLSAEAYGTLAARTAAAMRMADPHLELVAVGSSDSGMATFGTWDRTVLEHTYDQVDLLSAHAYYELRDGDLPTFLASALDLSAVVSRLGAIADEVKAARGGTKDILLSVDEWNVWYHDGQLAQEAEAAAADRDGDRGWPVAPPLFEDAYTVADAVVVGDLLMTLLEHADRVAAASLAQLVNAIAPIRTVTGGPAWRQATFHPFALTARHARGQVLRTRTEVAAQETAHGPAPLVHAVSTWDETDRTGVVLLVNRATDRPALVELDLAGLPSRGSVEAVGLWDDDPSATCTVQDPDRVRPRPLAVRDLGAGRVAIDLPPVCWALVQLRP
ncbi:MAG TPA: alpha-L-arabinofuranosidase C-terminal domain-containing protein [Cellulomonas sp.]